MVYRLPDLAFAPATMARMLDAFDYGVALVDSAGRTRFVNTVARRACTGSHPLTWDGEDLKAQRTEDAQLLAMAVEAACRKGLQRMILLGQRGDRTVAVSVVPVDAHAGDTRDTGARGDALRWHAARTDPTRWAMLILGKSRICDVLTIDAFARLYSLTSAECRVLRLLCGGDVPRGIARLLGVTVATVRTQIGVMRAKVGVASMAALINMVSTLPPMPRATPEAA